MQSRIKKWGNSLGVRIPQGLAASIGVGEDTAVDLSIEDGAIVIKPASKRVKLDDLLAGITSENTHTEVSWDRRKGREAW